jgi:hypothetical protein
MRPLVILLFAAVLAAPLHAEDAPQPGLLKRSWESAQFWKGWRLEVWRFGGEKEKPARAMGLELAMTLSPQPVKLSETRQIAVTMKLRNRSGRAVQLQFATSQRFDVWLRDGSGKTLERWSDDQSFVKEPVFVTVNPREYVEYTAKVATRDMRPGTLYTIRGAVLGHEGLSAEHTIIPEQ